MDEVWAVLEQDEGELDDGLYPILPSPKREFYH